MKKVIVLVLTSILMVIGGVALFMDHCVQPDQMDIALTQLKCAQAIELEAFIVEACEEIHGTPDCRFEDADRPAVEQLLLDKVNACTLAILKSQNMCVDKYEAM